MTLARFEICLEHPMRDRRGKRERSDQKPSDGIAKPQARCIVEVLARACGEKRSGQKRSQPELHRYRVDGTVESFPGGSALRCFPQLLVQDSGEPPVRI